MITISSVSFLFILAAFVLVLVGVTLLVLIRYIEHRAYEHADIEKIDRMTGLTFERYLVSLFAKLGYRVKKTSDQYDFGADLILKKDGVTTVVQAKRYKKNVGIDSVQQVVAAKKYYKAENALVVTNSFFTNSAMQLATSNNVELMHRNKLIAAIAWVRKKGSDEYR